jgi:phosphoribosylaminoimidazolecarboxamide formyltransferase/IMP cyclohydrolase
MYRLINGNLAFGNVQTIQPGRYLASDAELLQSGKHPGKINITDADNALNILRYCMDEPVVAIMKHNNPCGVAIGNNMLDAYTKANLADRVAAFGGTIALNRAVDKDTALAIAQNYSEVVVAPEFEEGVMDIFAKKENLRVMRIANMARLKEWAGSTVLDFKSLIDGGVIVQGSYTPEARTLEKVMALPLGYHNLTGKKTPKGYPHAEGQLHKIQRKPTEQEFKDMWFGWMIEAGVSSNSVLYIKEGVTLGIGTGQQDRVGVAEIARDKAYTKAKDRVCFEHYKISYNDLVLAIEKAADDTNERCKLLTQKGCIDGEVEANHAGLEGAAMISDAFFPERDGVDVGLRQGARAIIQAGGSIKDYESIEACNEAGATMVFTGQRSFKH